MTVIIWLPLLFFLVNHCKNVFLLLCNGKKIKPHTDSKLCLTVHNLHWETMYVQCNGKAALNFSLPSHLLPCVKGCFWSNFSFGKAILVFNSLSQYPILFPDLWDLPMQGELRTFSKVLAWWLKSVCPCEYGKGHKPGKVGFSLGAK